MGLTHGPLASLIADIAAYDLRGTAVGIFGVVALLRFRWCGGREMLPKAMRKIGEYTFRSMA